MSESDQNIRIEGASRASFATTVNGSGVSWGAILAGAAATAAFSLALLVLGTGLGLASVSPWVDSGLGAMTLGVSAILWISFTQIVSSGLGGYLAGRLRTKWVGTPNDEVHFRDTAHGFLAWAVAALIHAAVLTSVIATVVAGGVKAGATVAQGAAAGAAAGATTSTPADADKSNGPTAYFVDTLFRRDSLAPSTAPLPSTVAGVNSFPVANPSSDEVNRILVFNRTNEALPPDDVRYVAQLVSQRTGMNQGDAEKRVTDTYARFRANATQTEVAAKAAADKARKASSYGALWLFISWLTGAFVASLSATFGGRQRDL